MTPKLTTLPVTIFIVNILESLEKVAIKATCNDKIDTAASAKLIFLSDLTNRLTIFLNLNDIAYSYDYFIKRIGRYNIY